MNCVFYRDHKHHGTRQCFILSSQIWWWWWLLW